MKIAIVIAACVALAVAQDATPACRAVDADGALIVRDESGHMGCVSDAECIQYTDAGSWCKPDGTCKGCEDWTGCCTYEGGNPAAPECDYSADSDAEDEKCQKSTECSASFCKPDNTCHDCDDPEPTPAEPTCDCSEAECDSGFVADCGDDLVCNCNEIQNPNDPMCRQFYNVIVNNTEVAHLVPRGEDGAMGCVSHEECIQNTDAGSWCQEDGTCAGCEDWTGCCVTEGGNPATPECDYSADSDAEDEKCQKSTECSASFCKPDNTCHDCDDPEPTPEEPTCDCNGRQCPIANIPDCGDDLVCNCNPIQNPNDPMCRQFYNVIVNNTEVAHLVPRGEDGAMGCVSHEECQRNTDAGSWCQPDGTCAGCDDWTGCCVVEGGNPSQEPQCDFGEEGADEKCQSEYCEDSYCKGDGSCHECPQTPDEPEEESECGMWDHAKCMLNYGMCSYCKGSDCHRC